MLEKVEEGPYWDRLLESKLKQHWLKIDYKNWVDEDEEEEPGQGQDLGEQHCEYGYGSWIWMNVYVDDAKEEKPSLNKSFKTKNYVWLYLIPVVVFSPKSTIILINFALKRNKHIKGPLLKAPIERFDFRGDDAANGRSWRSRRPSRRRRCS